MERNDLVLAALAAGGPNASYSPVQLQKLFFLIDNEAAQFLEGPHFSFVPYDYGPFDRSVYNVLEALKAIDLAEITSAGRYRRYELSRLGFDAGQEILSTLDPVVQEYLKGLSLWVRSLSFSQLVAAIYKRYPNMKVNSVFVE